MTAASASASDAAVTIRGRITIESLHHVVLTVEDVAATVEFYADVLGMRHETLGDGRAVLRFGDQRLVLQPDGGHVEPKPKRATPGSADLCLLTRTPVEGVLRVLDERGVAVVEGPVERIGVAGRLLSVYVHDPDGNLVELSNTLID